jgi:hypothetical protein
MPIAREAEEGRPPVPQTGRLGFDPRAGDSEPSASYSAPVDLVRLVLTSVFQTEDVGSIPTIHSTNNKFDGGSASGRPSGFDPDNGGSNPPPPA